MSYDQYRAAVDLVKSGAMASADMAFSKFSVLFRSQNQKFSINSDQAVEWNIRSYSFRGWFLLAVLVSRCRLINKEIPMIKMKRSHGRLIFIWESHT